MNIINDPYRTFSGGLGASVGSGLASGLQSLADMKLEDIRGAKEQQRQQAARQQYSQNLAQFVPEPVANFVAGLPEKQQQLALQNLPGLMQLFSPNQEQVTNAPLGGAMGALTQGPMAAPAQLPQAQQLPEGPQIQGKKPIQIQNIAPQQPQARTQQEAQAQLLANAFTSPAEKREREKIELQKEKIAKAEEALNKRLEQAEKLQERKLQVQQELAGKKLASAELKEAKKIELEEKKLATKETKAYTDQTFAAEKAAKESDLRLGKLEKLVDKGNLPNSAWWSFLTKIEELGPIATGGAGAALGTLIPGVGNVVGAAIGGVVGALAGPLAGVVKSVSKIGNPDVEEFEKTSADFIKNAKQYFGSRLTDADLRAYLQTIPTLSQTDAGKKKIIDNLRSFNKLAEIEAKTVRNILKENKGVRPLDLQIQVQDRMKDEIDQVAKLFAA